jgi:hypothetical protein
MRVAITREADISICLFIDRARARFNPGGAGAPRKPAVGLRGLIAPTEAYQTQLRENLDGRELIVLVALPNARLQLQQYFKAGGLICRSTKATRIWTWHLWIWMK